MKNKFIRFIATFLILGITLTCVLTACKGEAKTGNFYVKYCGTGDGLSPQSPAGSVNAVKSIINSSLGEGDIANVWIMQDDSEDFEPLDFADAERKTHKMTVWKNSDEENIKHTAKIVVSTYIPEGETQEDTSSVYMAFSESIAKNSILELTGPTEFKNIKIVATSSTDTIDLSGQSGVFGKNTVFQYIDIKDGEDYASWQEVLLSPQKSNFTTVLSNDIDAVVENSIKTIFDNRVFESGNFYIPSYYGFGTQFKKDVTLQYNEANLASLQIIFGTGETSEKIAHFYGNLNVKMKKGDAIRVSQGATDIRVDGGAQFIVDPKTTYYTSEDKEYSFKSLENLKTVDQDGKTVSTDKWILYIDSSQQDYIDFIDGEKGKYSIKDGYMAVATNIDSGEEIISSWGKLTIETPGEYNVSVAKNFINNGDTIKVYKRCEIDLGKVSHTEKQGYAFTGWKTEKGEYPQRVQKYSKGTVLTAQYAKIDFAVEKTKINQGDGGEHDLVFVLNKSKKFYNKLPKPLEYGSIYLPTDDTLGAQMYINEPITLTWKWDSETGLDFEPVATGRTPLRVKYWKADNKKQSDKPQEYTLTIEDIDPDNYYTWYSVRGYIIYEDYNGLKRIVYSAQDNPDFKNENSNFDNDQSCIYEVAKETPESERGELENEIIRYVEVDRKEYYHQGNGILEYYSGYTGKGLTDENPLNKSYKLSNGLKIRDVTINTGVTTTEKTEICFITDPHFATIDKKDVLENKTNALSSYRGRDWTRGTDFRNKSLKYMEYASMFPKTVVGGDAVDYLTYGSIGAVSRLLTKKSVNGSIKMVLGNHEPSEMSQNDISGLSHLKTIDERYEILNNNWTNDVEYSSEIMKTKDGKDNIMLIYIDNAGKKVYNEIQLEKFKQDIKTARQKGLPVLIFQHIPLGTEETNYKDQASINFYTEIKKSADVVKGIFCGHIHETTLTHLDGLTEDGSASNVKIPQYSGGGAHYNNVMKITVE